MRKGRTRFAVLLGLLALAFVALIGLGVWQVHRLAWKEALIARVDARVAASPISAPGPAYWPGVSAKSAEYLHVSLAGHYAADKDTRVKAVTDRGSGFWLMTPFVTDRGFTVLVNRGFVPGRAVVAIPEGQRVVTGLLRISEPGGAFLRSNDPAQDHWYSRDVAAIAKARGLHDVAPYFVDAGEGQDVAGGPVGGLTAIRFPNNHLVYAITWFAMAFGVVIGAALLIRERFRSQKA